MKWVKVPFTKLIILCTNESVQSSNFNKWGYKKKINYSNWLINLFSAFNLGLEIVVFIFVEVAQSHN